MKAFIWVRRHLKVAKFHRPEVIVEWMEGTAMDMKKPAYPRS